MAADDTQNGVDETDNLGRARFDHDTAAVGDRDNVFYANGCVIPHSLCPAPSSSQ